jgi:HNH endonuclease
MDNWIKFVEIDLRDGRKTKVWAVMTIDGSECLGRISWYSPWRRYCYVINQSCADLEEAQGSDGVWTGQQVILEWDCLRKIADFCELQTEAHRSKRKAITHINGNIYDNRLENLRIVTIKENL